MEGGNKLARRVESQMQENRVPEKEGLIISLKGAQQVHLTPTGWVMRRTPASCTLHRPYSAQCCEAPQPVCPIPSINVRKNPQAIASRRSAMLGWVGICRPPGLELCGEAAGVHGLQGRRTHEELGGWSGKVVSMMWR